MATRGTTITGRYFAYDTVNRAGKTLDVANHTIKIQLDNNAPATPINVLSEIDSVNLPGWYEVQLDVTETDCNTLLIGGKSSTSGIVIQGAQYSFEGNIIFPMVPTTSQISTAVLNILAANFASIPSVNAITAAILGMLIEGNHTFQEIMKYVAAFVGGISGGGGTSELTFRNLDNSIDRIKYDLDSHNNRTIVTRDVS